MKLIIDIGNTRTKIAFFNDNQLSHIEQTKELSKSHLLQLINQFPQTDNAILSAVKNYSPYVTNSLKKNFKNFIEIGANTSIPIINLYKTPETLGYDRLASAIGAETLLPGQNLLVIDAGTAITYDIVTSQKEYLGGSISPGIWMRYKALHYFTGKLPQIKPAEQIEIPGKDTESSIHAGVQFGTIFEMKGIIDHYKKRFENLKVILTGGDADFFKKNLNESIVVNANLNLLGLNRILKYNESSLL